MKKVTGISLFSGAGGLDLGAEAAGISVAFQNEIDRDAVSTLMENRNGHKRIIDARSVTDLESADLRGVVRRTNGVIVFGGPPCQPFSKNGYWVKNENRLKTRDPRNLIGEFFRVVRLVGPDGFLMENVESMLHPTNMSAVTNVLRTAEALGYSVHMYRADATRYGVPQRRKRVFFFGVRGRNRIIPDPLATHGSEEEILANRRLSPIPGVGDFIAPFSDKKYFEPQEVCRLGTYYEELKRVPPGKNYLVLSSKKPNRSSHPFVTGGRFWNFLLKLHPERPSWTIPAQPGPWVGPFHWTNRRLRTREIAAIQTFPKEYRFCGSRRSIQRQIGNAVPVALGQAMFSHLLKYL